MKPLFILGNGFDRAHDLKTSYWHFKKWLMTHGRLDVIAELQSLFPAQQDGEFLLWSQFEKALTLYDKAAVEGWAWDSLYLAIEEEDGKETVTSLSFSFLYTYNSCFSTLALAGRPLFLVIGLAFET